MAIKGKYHWSQWQERKTTTHFMFNIIGNLSTQRHAMDSKHALIHIQKT